MAERRWTTRKLAELTLKARKAGVRVAVQLADGNPATQIARIAKAGPFDLLIIGTHGRTGLAKFFLGSVTGRVVATASCPFVTVRGRD
jgi:nucleotide-binding universal stress UspA family protein